MVARPMPDDPPEFVVERCGYVLMVRYVICDYLPVTMATLFFKEANSEPLKMISDMIAEL